MILDRINNVNDIKQIDPSDYAELAREIRSFLLEKISVTGGHLASNLGVVELTMALHLAFDMGRDKIVWDVGHQSYTHKILTGRKDGFDDIRTYGGISGFPNHKESKYDAFNTGHSSTSISAGLGLAQARDLAGEDFSVISVIGDGALTGGMAYEALNNASRMKTNFIIILNDNNMSISENIGSVSRMTTSLRTAPGYNRLKASVTDTIRHIPKFGDHLVQRISSTKSSFKQLFISDLGMFFEDLGLTYLGPVDGYNIDEMLQYFEDAKRLNRSVVVHVMTKKGKGYKPAENDPEAFHGVGAFEVKTGKAAKSSSPSYSSIFGKALCHLAEKDDRIVAITAAMADGVGLKSFAKRYPGRFFDVGIAEEHAVTFAAGLAAGGRKPYVCVYSSFLQRAYDQMIHDVCLQELPVTFIIDRAGIVGSDGETHQGIFDLSFLSTIPHMVVMAPKNNRELVTMLRYTDSYSGPIAIRYPRGAACAQMREFDAPIEYRRAEVMYLEKDIALMAVGSMVETAVQVREMLKEAGYNVTLVNARFVRPFDKDLVKELSEDHDLLVTMEENVRSGGFGEHVAAYVAELDLPIRVLTAAIANQYVEHGNVNILKKVLGLDADSIYKLIIDNL